MEIGGEYSVLDHHGVLSGHALVVEIDRSAVAADGAVVDDGDALAAYPFAHPSGEYRLSLAVEVGLEGVTHGFVQEDTGSPGAHDDGHPPAFGPPGGEALVDALHGL